jgi:MFS family permease
MAGARQSETPIDALTINGLGPGGCMVSAESHKNPVSWMLKATILFASVPVALAYAIVSPILAKMSDELAHDATDAYFVKMILGVLGVAMVIGAPIAGFLADKLGRRPLLVGSGLLFAVAGAAPFALHSLPAILFTRFLVGIAGVAFATGGVTMVGDYFDDSDRPRWMGALLASSMLASLAAVPLSGLMGDTGWRWPFLLYLVGVPIAMVAWLGIGRASSAPAHALGATVSSSRSGNDRHFPIELALLGLLAGVLMYLPAIYVPFQLRDLGMQNPSSVAVGLTLNLLVGAVMSSQFGWARGRYSSRALFCFSFGAMALGVGLLALAPSYPVAFGGLFIMGLGGWLYPNLLTLTIASVDEHHRGRTVGWVRAAQSIAPAVGVTAFQPLVIRLGVVSALLLIAGIATLMLVGMAARVFTLNYTQVTPAK